jgi:hypothetical protein
MTTTGTGDPTDFDRAPGSTAIIEALARAPSDFEPGSLATSEARDTAARKAREPERPPDSVNREYRSRLFSGQALRIEAAIDSEIDSILPVVRPAGPPQSLAGGATSQIPALSPAAAASPTSAKAPQQSSEITGGQGWIIETE